MSANWSGTLLNRLLPTSGCQPRVQGGALSITPRHRRHWRCRFMGCSAGGSDIIGPDLGALDSVFIKHQGDSKICSGWDA